MRATAVLDARYDAAQDLLELTQRNGKVRLIPRRMFPELDGVPTAILRSIAVSPAGDAISWLPRGVNMNPRAPGAPWPTDKGVYVAYAPLPHYTRKACIGGIFTFGADVGM
jgi:hypothetical protein